jgi:hypothetical protein
MIALHLLSNDYFAARLRMRFPAYDARYLQICPRVHRGKP